jgi:hypothetical protein
MKWSFLRHVFAGKPVGLIAFGLWLVCPSASAQYYEEKPYPEISIGVKVLKGTILYGPKDYYRTDQNSIGFQASTRFNFPVKVSSKSPYQLRYIDFVVETGFAYHKARVFDSLYRDPVTNILTQEKSKNPTYLPVYAGLFTRNTISVGSSLFYWKGLGTTDLWGSKFMSLAYNAPNFRLSCAGEWYAQVRNGKRNGFLFSIEFLWKLILRD